MVIFTVPGEPQGKARPRVTKYGTYTPQKTKDYQKQVAQAFLTTVSDAEKQRLWDIPIALNIVARFGIPKSTAKTMRKAIYDKQVLPTKMPDADNIAKIIMDGLNGVAYADDKQVCELIVKKEYVVEGMQPHVVVFIGEGKPNSNIWYMPE